MGEIVQFNDSSQLPDNIDDSKSLQDISKELLLDARAAVSRDDTVSMPIAELVNLGDNASSLLSALHEVTTKKSADTEGLYRLANIGDGTLKAAKNGNFWGAFKDADGKSKMLQIQAVEPMDVENVASMPINPATMMMAVALFSIEQQLGNIEEIGKQIISFLEIEKQSEIEADVEFLTNVIGKYKHNWNNERFVASNHKMVLDIQRTARKNMLAYQKQVSEIVNANKLLVIKSKVNSTLEDIEKKLKYYRLSLYTFSMASFMEIMLSGNFKEENIEGIIAEIDSQSLAYRELFRDASSYLEKISNRSVEDNLAKGVGTASNAIGKAIGRIPLVEKGPVDEFLQDKGSKLKQSAKEREKEPILALADASNPGTGLFLDKMHEMVRIYNHTSEICFDQDNIYLLA